jgi:hypothetical protein
MIGTHTVDDLWAIGAWLAREAAELLRRLREPGLWAALLVGLLLWCLAYQAAPGSTIFVGGDPQAHKRDYDTPFLVGDGFNDAEPGTLKRDDTTLEWWRQPIPPYRWAKDQAAIVLPGIGGGRWVVGAAARSGRPDGASVESEWQIGDEPPLALTIDAGPHVYTIAGLAAGGDLRLALQTPRLAGPGDPSKRNLGLVIHRVTVTPAEAGGLHAPAPGQLALLALLVALIYSLARRLALPLPWSFTLAAGVAIAASALLAAHRLALTIWTPALALLALIAYALAILLLPLLGAAARALELKVAPRELGAALGATIAAFALRMAGLLHPYAQFSDLGFHINNLDEVIRGDLFLYAGLPAELGGGRAPYPPAQYLALAPLRLLFGDERIQSGWLIQGGNALLESGTAALIWLLLRRAGLGRRAALLGAALYITVPPLLRSFSVGEFANIFGQSWLLPLLLFLALGAPRARRWPIALLGGLRLLVMLLSHTGVTISTLALLLAWLPMWWFDRRPTTADHGSSRFALRSLRLPIAWGLAGLLALILFYSSYGALLGQQRAVASAAASEVSLNSNAAPARPVGDKLFGELRAGFSLAKGLSPLLSIPGGLGLFLLWKRQAVRLDLALLACWLGMLLSLGTLLRADQAVRWQAFLYPALCLGAGPMFAASARRGRAGAALVAVALLYLTWIGVALWAQQIANYLH